MAPGPLLVGKSASGRANNKGNMLFSERLLTIAILNSCDDLNPCLRDDNCKHDEIHVTCALNPKHVSNT